MGNRKLGDRYLFGGFQPKRPLDIQGNYKGDDGDLKLESKKMPLSRWIFQEIVYFWVGTWRWWNYPTTGCDRKYSGHDSIQERWISGDLNETKNKKKIQTLKSVAQPRQEVDVCANHAFINQIPLATSSESMSFKVLKDLEVALRTDDKDLIQESMDETDKFYPQVILHNAPKSEPVMILNSTLEGLSFRSLTIKSCLS